MFKKIIFIVLLSIVVFIGIDFYNSQKTTECWWGVLYPTLSFIAVEDEEDADIHTSAISSSDDSYFYLNKDTNEIEENSIKFKMAIVEWFKKHF